MPLRQVLDVSPERAEKLVQGVLDRRRAEGDAHLARASTDALGVVRHVIRFPGGAGRLLAEDVLDALELLEFARRRVAALPGVYDQLEHDVLGLRERAGLSLGDIGMRLEVSRQAVDARLRRGRAAGQGLARSEVADRAFLAAEGQLRRWRKERAVSARTVMSVLGEHVGELAADEHVVDMIEILLAPDDSRRPPAVTDPVQESDMVLLRRVLQLVRSSSAFGSVDQFGRLRASVDQGQALVDEYDGLSAGFERFRGR